MGKYVKSSVYDKFRTNKAIVECILDNAIKVRKKLKSATDRTELMNMLNEN